MAAVREPIQQGRGHPFALEDLAPFAEGQVAGDQKAAPLVAIGEHLEEQLGAAAAERQVAELIADEQIDAVELGQQAVEAMLLMGLLQLTDQAGGGEEPHPFAEATGGETQRGGDMGFSRAGVADEAAVVVLLDPFAARQFEDLLLVERRQSREVVTVEVLGHGEVGGADTGELGVGGAGGHLQLGQPQQVRVVRFAAVGGLAMIPLRTRLPESPHWLVERGDDEEALALVEEAERFAATQGPPPPVVELKPPVALRSFWVSAALFLAFWLIYYVGNYGWLTLAPTMLTDEGFSLTSSLSFLCVTGIGLIVGAVGSVRYSERFERKFTISVSLVVFAVALIVIGLEPVASVIMVFGFIVSATIGFAVPLMYVKTAEQCSGQLRARGVAIGDGIGHLGGAAAPLVILPAAAAGFFWGMGLMALTGLIAAVLILFGQRMTGRAMN